MTDEELKQLVASLAISNKELRDFQKENAISNKELSNLQKENAISNKELRDLQKENAISNKELRDLQKEIDIQLKENAIQQKETDRKLDKVAKMIGGIGANQGDVAEDFFYNSFIQDNHLGQLSFDDITKNMFKHRGKMQEEYDIFLTNGDAIAIVEVKYKAHLADIKKLDRKFKHFKTLFPIYKDYKLYGAMASFYFNKETKDELLKQGYFVVERCGDLVKTENSDTLKVA